MLGFVVFVSGPMRAHAAAFPRPGCAFPAEQVGLVLESIFQAAVEQGALDVVRVEVKPATQPWKEALGCDYTRAFWLGVVADVLGAAPPVRGDQRAERGPDYIDGRHK